MTTKRRKTLIEFGDMELAVMLTLLESTIGGPTWRCNERAGVRLLAKIEDHATRPRERVGGEGVAHGDDHQSPA